MVFCIVSLPNLVFAAQLLVFSSSVEESNSLLGWHFVSKKTVKSNCLKKDGCSQRKVTLQENR